MNELVDFDNSFITNNTKLIAGIDEAGRGPLAGPVCVALAIMPLDDVIDGVNDSKKLSEKKREALFEIIKDKAVAYFVNFVDSKTIDKINILEATKLGMKNCINCVKIKPDLILIDAVKIDCEIETVSIIKGDAKSYNIACASILAKVLRDRLMKELDKKYPNYNFKKHKGYGTKEHISILKKIGPSEEHRRTFIKNFINN